ncbi:MAG TPA: hypothetical protein GX525_12050 [Bacilli bacterium]|nr:hypothetical protein [Bacilli bacterium]
MKYLKIMTMIVFMFMFAPGLTNANDNGPFEKEYYKDQFKLSLKDRVQVGGKSYVYEFKHPVNISGVIIDGSSDSVYVDFWFKEGGRVRHINTNGTIKDVDVKNVVRLTLSKRNTVTDYVYNFEIFAAYNFEVFQEVKNVRGVTYYNRIYLEWDNPEHEDLKKILIYKDNKLIEEVLAPLNYRDIRNLEPETEYTFVLKSYYDPPGEVTEGVSFTATTKAVPEVVDFHANTLNYHIVEINFFNPNTKAILYEGTKKIAETTDYKFLLDKLEAGKKYDFVLKSITDDGYTSKGVPVSFTLPAAPQLEEIKEVKANATHERVDLSWRNPIYNPNFNFVRIYRKELTKPTSFINQALFGSVVKANTGYVPLFETNGTYFNDLTVEPETTYEYKLTTENISGVESEGVTIQVTTLESPAPSMGGVVGEETENGDYVYTWTSPTTGTVKIMVGGKEYKTVPASDGKITIPAGDMKYTMLGAPDVRLIAISESGKEGKPTNPGSLIGAEKIGFSANDLLNTAVGLLFIVGPFILLSLAFIFVPRLIELIKRAAKRRNDMTKDVSRRERA